MVFQNACGREGSTPDQTKVCQQVESRYMWPSQELGATNNHESPPFTSESFWGILLPLNHGIHIVRVSVAEASTQGQRVLTSLEKFFDVSPGRAVPAGHGIRSIRHCDSGWLRHAYMPVLGFGESTASPTNRFIVKDSSVETVSDLSGRRQKETPKVSAKGKTRTAVCVSGQIHSLNLRPSSVHWPKQSSRDSTTADDLQILSKSMGWNSVAESIHKNVFSALDDFDVFFSVATRGEPEPRSESDCEVLRPRKVQNSTRCLVLIVQDWPILNLFWDVCTAGRMQPILLHQEHK